MKDFSKSTFIFDLIDEFQLFDKKGNPNPLTDETFNSFTAKYLEQAKTRDHSLLNYLHSKPDFFRTFLPKSKWTFDIARDLVWFYNELIISDPMVALIKENKPIESKKQNLLPFLKTASLFKEAIEGGYMRFAGDVIISDKTDYESEANKILSFPEVLNAFEKITWMGKKPSPINDDPNDNLIQLEALYEGHLMQVRPVGMYLPEHVKNTPGKLSKGVLYDFRNNYERTDREELMKLGKTDILDGIKHVYKEDISIIINSIMNSSAMNTPSLFFRHVDSLVAQKFGDSLIGNQNPLIADRTLYDCTLPYLQEVPPERLLNLREQIPSAFEDFREFLYETVKEARQESSSIPEFRYNVERKIKGKLKNLEKEANTASRKLKFATISNIIVATGSLMLNSWIGIIGGSGALINANNAFDSYIDRKENLKANPLYFMWKAQGN